MAWIIDPPVRIPGTAIFIGYAVLAHHTMSTHGVHEDGKPELTARKLSIVWNGYVDEADYLANAVTEVRNNKGDPITIDRGVPEGAGARFTGTVYVQDGDYVRSRTGSSTYLYGLLKDNEPLFANAKSDEPEKA